MKRALSALPPVLLAACVAAPPPPLDVAVTKSGEVWTADFTFPRRARAWVFVRSALTRESEQPWRPQSWTIETPDVRLERRGHYDVLARTDGRRLPEHVRVRIVPFPGDLIADYDPALVFTDGSIALFSGQFEAFPLRSAARAERLPIDLSGTRAPPSPTRVAFTDAGGAVLHGGRRQESVSVQDNDGTYVLFGPAEPAVSEAMTTIIDPALPEWIRLGLLRDTPAVLARYEAELGPVPGLKPTLMVSWAGATPRLASMGGSVLPGLITMTYEGTGVLVENEGLRRQGLWFIAHEAAHFWLGQAVTYQFSRDSWITEGGADLLAIRAVGAVDPGYDPRAALQSAVDDCASLSTGRGIASAEQRNEHRAYYACGALFGLVAEAASRRPFAEFVRDLVAANLADRVVTRSDWLAALDRASGDQSLSADIAGLLDRGADDPKALLASILSRAGIDFTLAEDGTPRLQ
ncbi:MAG: M1 family aminopeptidase [Allosphingosinicella sp.]